ncbi:MAG: hypothetical protein IKO49_06175 [Bacilli bacterium]|nr:hypothetical protein [Bacilli bacterium]
MKLKKSVKRKIVLIFIILLIALLVFLYLKFYGTKEVTKSKVIDEIKEYGYTLKDTKNDEYKKEFKNLSKILSEKKINEKEYAKSVSKLFIIDFYSLKDKLAKTDIGGEIFVHKDAKETFLEKAKDTIYKYVETNLYGNRTQKLPSVESVKINKIENISYEFGDNNGDDNAFQVSVSWSYKDNFDDNYQTKATIIIVHEDKKLSIVELK